MSDPLAEAADLILAGMTAPADFKPLTMADLAEAIDRLYPKRKVFVHPSRLPWVDEAIKAEFGDRVEVVPSELVNPKHAYIADQTAFPSPPRADDE